MLASQDAAVKILCDSGLSHSIAQVKTIYANQGDHIFYKEVSASKGMLLIIDGKVQKFQPNRGNRVVVAVVKNYS
tara:strand:+ start:1534 stop:1758 length:225 start_codon:yes stop_codon:yes gene_type:complete